MRTTDRIPRVVLRVRLYVALGLFTVFLCARLVRLIDDRMPTWALNLTGDIIFALLLIILVLQYWRERRLKSRLLGADYRLCERCAYNLTGLPARHRCPECGSAYDIEQTRAIWKRWRPLLPWLRHE